MAYLIPSDYRQQIQDANLQQIISADPTVLERVALTAESEAKSYLKQKYDVAAEFTDTLVWSPSGVYNAGDRVYLTAAPYNPASTYFPNFMATYQGRVYVCGFNNITGPFDSTKWEDIGLLNQIFHVPPPQPLFHFESIYRTGDQVFWKNKVYTALLPSDPIGHAGALEVGQYQNLPYPNREPGTAAGMEQWGAGTSYSTFVRPDDPSGWSPTDNRDQQLVMYLIDMALYHVHSRIAPRNVPELRTRRYEAAIEWLRMCADGSVTPALPVLQPKTGGRIRFGGNVKLINTY